MPNLSIYQEILPHPTDAGVLITPVRFGSAVESAEDAIARFVITDGTEDRHGSRINPAGWEMGEYAKNPVVLWSHNKAIPAIASGFNMTNLGSRWEMGVRFAIDSWRAEGIGNLAQLLWNLVRDNVIRTGSQGFIPKEWKDLEEGAKTVPSFYAENTYYERQEMTEFSLVNVPSNRNAIKKALDARQISDNEATLLGLDAMVRLAIPINVIKEGTSVPETGTSEAVAENAPVDETRVSPDEADTEDVEEIATDDWHRYAIECENCALSFEIVARAELTDDDLAEAPCPLCDEEEGAQFEAAALRVISDLASNERVGAVLNKKNRDRLAKIKELADEVLASAEKAEETKDAPEETVDDLDSLASRMIESARATADEYEDLIASLMPGGADSDLDSLVRNLGIAAEGRLAADDATKPPAAGNPDLPRDKWTLLLS